MARPRGRPARPAHGADPVAGGRGSGVVHGAVAAVPCPRGDGRRRWRARAADVHGGAARVVAHGAGGPAAHRVRARLGERRGVVHGGAGARCAGGDARVDAGRAGGARRVDGAGRRRADGARPADAQRRAGGAGRRRPPRRHAAPEGRRPGDAGAGRGAGGRCGRHGRARRHRRVDHRLAALER